MMLSTMLIAQGQRSGKPPESDKIIHTEITDTYIIDIQENQNQWIGWTVRVKGIVDELIPDKNGNYYLLKDAYGGVCAVNCRTFPEVGYTYTVTGRVQKDAIKTLPIIIEVNRARDIDWIIIAVFIVLGIVIIALIFYMVYFKRRIKAMVYKKTEQEAMQKADITPPKGGTGPATLFLLPGKLEIISGPNKDLSFPIGAIQSGNMKRVLIGRENRHNDPGFLELGSKFNTVSAEQAEIRYMGSNVYIKNLSDVNNTCLNGDKMQLNEQREIKSGDVVKMGELEMKYVE